MDLLFVSCVVSLALGAFLQRIDVKKRGTRDLNLKNISFLQAIYIVLFAYPFCALYVWLDQSL